MFAKLKRNLFLVVVIPILIMGWAPVAGATQPEGPVTIITEIDFSEFPFSGPFSVTEGDDILGCPSGTFIDLPRGFGVIQKIFTCTGGSGTFIFLFTPFASTQWVAWKATDAFDGLRGEGDFSLAITGETTGEETFTGVIHFEP